MQVLNKKQKFAANFLKEDFDSLKSRIRNFNSIEFTL